MIISGKIVDIHQRRIYNGFVEIEDGHIRSIGESSVKGAGYIMPGFIDSHVHVESSMLTPASFGSAAAMHGTVAVVCDPHEIANVLGVDGIDFMIANSKGAAIDFYFGVPSCVPATPFESNGAYIGIDETQKLLERSDVKFLAEMMNFPGVLSNDNEVIGKLELARIAGKPVDGHAPGLTGEDLRSYIGHGITTDHEATNLEEAREKISGGMKILIREGSAARNLEELHPLIGEFPDKVMLCCDDIHPEMLMVGHINRSVIRLIRKGYDLYDVLRSASLNAVNHYKLDTGLLRMGDRADFIVVDNLSDFNILSTWSRGTEVYRRGMDSPLIPAVIPVNRFNSKAVSAEDIKVKRAGSRMRVMEVFDGQLYTGEIIEECDTAGIIESDPQKDLLKLVVKDRYRDLPPATAFIRGFGLKRGAFAGSVAHDSHNIIAVGADDESIAGAINEIIRMKGGLSVYDNRKVDSLVLDIGGILANVPCGTMAARYEQLSARVKELGCSLDSPFMTLSFMALLVIPDLKLGDRGLFRLDTFSFVDLFV